MIARIRQLSPIMANQIAAGEVIERPASVVKELLENSIDAGSSFIEITVAQGGTSLIRIVDNGCGIEKDDLSLALSRHATSKISILDDLTGITSLGFRGEALASIASVSHLSLISAVDKTAWKITVAGEELMPVITAAAHPKGTTIEVQDLFFNTPVRRKFLRSERTENNHIEDIMKRAALSHFEIAFKFTIDGKEVWNLAPAFTLDQQEKRIAKICGKNFLSNSLQLHHQAEGLQLSGWINSPEHSRAYSDLQYFFLNGRMVRDKVLTHALRSATQDSIPEGRYLGYVLYLQCDPKTVDVNVHPTKHEVRFEQARLVHDFIGTAVKKSFKKLCEPLDFFQHKQSDYMIQEAITEYRYPNVTATVNAEGKLGNPIAQIKQRYIISETQDAILLIDLYVAQKILLQQQLQAAVTEPLISQPILFPEHVTLTTAAIKKLSNLSLAEFGIVWQQTAENSLVVRALPSFLKKVVISELLQELLKTEDVKQSIASIAAKIPVILTPDAMKTLLRKLEQLTDLPTNCYRTLALT